MKLTIFSHRAVLVLKCEQGFVGFKNSSSSKLECNKASYDTIKVERAEQGGQVYLKSKYKAKGYAISFLKLTFPQVKTEVTGMQLGKELWLTGISRKDFIWNSGSLIA